MKKCLAYLCFVVLSSGIFGAASNAQAQAADTGPYYVKWTGTCFILQVYLTSTGVLYGKEIGCSEPHVAGGAYISGNRAGLGYTYLGSDRIYEIAMDGTIKIWLNNGTSLSLFNSGTWTLSSTPDPLLGAKTWLPSPND